LAGRDPSRTTLGISARGSDAAQAPQVQISPSRPFIALDICQEEIPRERRSGFRCAAQTPRKRLKFKSRRPDRPSSQPELVIPSGLDGCLQALECRVR